MSLGVTLLVRFGLLVSFGLLVFVSFSVLALVFSFLFLFAIVRVRFADQNTAFATVALFAGAKFILFWTTVVIFTRSPQRSASTRYRRNCDSGVDASRGRRPGACDWCTMWRVDSPP